VNSNFNTFRCQKCEEKLFEHDMKGSEGKIVIVCPNCGSLNTISFGSEVENRHINN